MKANWYYEQEKMSVVLICRQEKMVGGKMHSVLMLNYTFPQSEREERFCNEIKSFQPTTKMLLCVPLRIMAHLFGSNGSPLDKCLWNNLQVSLHLLKKGPAWAGWFWQRGQCYALHLKKFQLAHIKAFTSYWKKYW